LSENLSACRDDFFMVLPSPRRDKSRSEIIAHSGTPTHIYNMQ
jgi:hypothetical protein